MNLFYRYLRAHKKGFFLYLIFILVFAGIFILFHLPVGAVLYAAAIYCFIGIMVLVPDLLSFRRKHMDLQNQIERVSYTLKYLPKPESILDEDYQALIRALYMEKARLEEDENRRYTELVDYYTVWVHQIKTPIAAMHLKLKNEDSPLGRELSGELQRIEQYVEMVLCYLRLDSDTTDYVIKEYDLDGIVRQAVRKFASGFIGRKIVLNYQPLQCTVLTDEKWMLFVIEQVLSNALKYTMTGSVTISLETPKTLCIRDTGIGIAPEDLPRIFEKGYTGYNGRIDKKASGLGLYLCRRICGNLGHKITAVSSEEGGTVIRIDLDRKKYEAE